MTQASDNKEILKRAAEAWHESKGANPECWTSVMAPDIELISLASGEDDLDFTVARTGIADVEAYFSSLNALFEMSHFTINDYVAENDRVVAVGSTAWTSRESGKSFDTPHVLVAQFRDGKIVELTEYYNTAMVAKAL